MRRSLIAAGALAFIVSGTALAISCADPPSQQYGNPNGLLRKNLPGDGGGVSPLSCAGDGGPQLLADGGCAVSFTRDLLPYFQSNGTWHCADAVCHGGGKQPPPLTCSPDAGAGPCIASLGNITVGGIPYLSTDGGQAGIICNLQGSCGNKMPLAPGKDPTEDDLCKVTTWMACGAPIN